MQTIIPASRPVRRIRPAVSSSSTPNFRQPSYDCREQPDAVRLTVYVPGVEAAGVEIESRGPDLLITARKSHFVRVNWQALHLETAQRDYQLRLRLGHGIDYPALHAEITSGVLTLVLPKRQPAEDDLSARRVA
ncbi:MAG TPA: Hsp20/alpha crystallin family protein [Opitutus sp.]|nr:Hsp20/alpha crystallin family protein [Opitutus sp.]